MSASRGAGFLALRDTPTTRTAATATLVDLPPLPETAKELRVIAEALGANPDTDVHLRERASEETVKASNLAEARVIAFATHGLLPHDLDGLTQPALALSSPAVTGGQEDGLLTTNEILELRLDADWVVLSACNTAAADGAGAEAISGLGRAFFHAGARALLVSQWPVHSHATADLTVHTFRQGASVAGLPRSEALRHAMVWMIDHGAFVSADGTPMFSYAHPIFWAPFIVVGDGRGA